MIINTKSLCLRNNNTRISICWPFNILPICCTLFQWRSSLTLESKCQEEIYPKSMTACSSTCTGEMAPAFRARSTRWTVFAIPWRCGTDALFIQITRQPTVVGALFLTMCFTSSTAAHCEHQVILGQEYNCWRCRFWGIGRSGLLCWREENHWILTSKNTMSRF